MQKIFISVSEDIIIRNIIETDFWPIFISENKDKKIFIIVKEEKKDYFKKINSKNIEVITYKHGEFSRINKILFSLARSAIKNHTNLLSKMRALKKGDSNIFPTYIKRIYTFLLGGNGLYKKILRKLILSTKSDNSTINLFNTYNPDILISLSLTNFEFDVPLAKEAKKRNIKVIGMVRSWDNLSSHGLLRVVPDVFILQNKFLNSMAKKYQAISEDNTKVLISGIPHYDIYKNYTDFLIPRDEFFKIYGLDINKKLILYAAMGDFLFEHEPEMVYVFDQIIKENLVKKPVQILFRKHPKFSSDIEKKIKATENIKADINTLYIDKKNINNTKIFLNTIVHSDVIVTGASTVALDSIALGKPVICIGFNGLTPEKKVNYWLSVKRFYDTYTHFEEVVKTKAIDIVFSKKELAEKINKYLDNPKLKEEERERAIDLFIDPFNGKSGKRLANYMNENIK